MLARFVLACERLIFGHRKRVLALLALITVVAAFFASRLHMSAGFGKQLPLGHEYTETFVKYKDVLFGANRLIVVVHAKQGDIWKPETLKKLNDVTQALLYLPGVDRRSVSSLWTPNTRVMQVTEEGYEARDVIGGDITPEKLDAATVAKIRDNVVQGGYVGSLVASDSSGAMVTADLLDADPRTKEATDYIALGPQIEAALRTKFEDAGHEIRIIGFAKQISDIAEGAQGVVVFFALAFVLTALAVWWYCRSWAFTAAALVCSLVSLVWQFASLQLLGYGLDPLAVLVPFLVFAIGVSHGVQQINTIVREIGAGKTPDRRRALQLRRAAGAGHDGAGHGLRRLRDAAADPDPDDPRAGDHGLARRGLQDRHQPDHAAGGGLVRAACPRYARAHAAHPREALAGGGGAGAPGRAEAGAPGRHRQRDPLRPGAVGQPRPPYRLRAARRARAARQRALQPRRCRPSPRSFRSASMC